MARGKQYTNFLLNETDKIIDIVDEISPKMSEYIKNANASSFVLLYKCINHSDLISSGKAEKIDNLQKNILYYITVAEMKQIEQKTNAPFQTAHQSCISLSGDFYKNTGLQNPRDVGQYKISQFCKAYLVNDTLEYFNSSYTKKILAKLDKKVDWNFEELDIQRQEGDFTPIEITFASQGFGTASDKEFHKLRNHIFKSDTFIILYEKGKKQNNLFILLEKNPAFFSLLGLSNKSYSNYLNTIRKRIISNVQQTANAIDIVNLKEEEEVTRQQQSKWRTMLAKEMMGYTQIEGQVFCPFTYITANFDELGPLFVASHIKGFSDPNTTNEEKYDLYNGLLLCANADALFDKHLISVDQDKNLVFSFTLEKDPVLKQRLCLMQPIFQAVLNDKRMEYLKYHKAEFDRLEIERKRG